MAASVSDVASFEGADFVSGAAAGMCGNDSDWNLSEAFRMDDLDFGNQRDNKRFCFNRTLR
jgi:hypothetical protein